MFTAVPEQFVVGTSDESGNLAIQPRHNSNETGFTKVANIRSYGGVPDWTFAAGAVFTDNLHAFNRAMYAASDEFQNLSYPILPCLKALTVSRFSMILLTLLL